MCSIFCKKEKEVFFLIVVGLSLDSDSTCGALYHSIHKDSGGRGGSGVGPNLPSQKKR